MAHGGDGRGDVSRFLVHLTRDYGGAPARRNLLSMLLKKRIEARNPHCLFVHQIKSELGLTSTLQKQFNSVCLTEAPLDQIQHLSKEIPSRKIHLRPYGLVFWRDDLLERGANPALYISDKSPGLRQHLLAQFRGHFCRNGTHENFVKAHGAAKAGAIINYYSLVNLISKKHDFSWEREWRFRGQLTFDYQALVAIIAENPEEFRGALEKASSRIPSAKQLLRIPIISPAWGYELVVEEMSFRIWSG